MTTHIMFPALDTARPATLSPNVITGLLRNELGYDGVVVTDCMEMKAIADNFGTAEAAVMAVEAGVDLVLVCHTLSAQREAREAILKAAKDGRISEARIDASVRRVRALKERFSLASRRSADPAALRGVLRSKEHLALQKRIAEASVTLVRNDAGTIPLKLGPGERVLVCGLHSSVAPLARAIEAHWGQVDVVEVRSGDAGTLEAALQAAKQAGAVIVATCPNEPWKPAGDLELQRSLVKSLAALGARLVVVAVREPYDLRRFPEAGTYICSYGYREASLEAAAALIFGRIPPRGRLPVTIPALCLLPEVR